MVFWIYFVRNFHIKRKMKGSSYGGQLSTADESGVRRTATDSGRNPPVSAKLKSAADNSPNRIGVRSASARGLRKCPSRTTLCLPVSAPCGGLRLGGHRRKSAGVRWTPNLSAADNCPRLTTVRRGNCQMES